MFPYHRKKITANFHSPSLPLARNLAALFLSSKAHQILIGGAGCGVMEHQEQFELEEQPWEKEEIVEMEIVLQQSG